MTLKEERRMVLNMVKESTITVEEGECLFEALEESKPVRPARRQLHVIEVFQTMDFKQLLNTIDLIRN